MADNNILTSAPEKNCGFCYNAVSLCVMMLSLICQLAGFVSPGWLYAKGASHTVHWGLWYVVDCKEKCTTYSFNEYKIDGAVNLHEGRMQEFQVETILAILASIFAIVTLFVHLRNSRLHYQNKILYALTLAAILSAGALCLVAAGKFGDYVLYFHKHPDLSSESDSIIKYLQKDPVASLRFPYSLFLTGLGGLFASFVFFVLLAVFQC